MATDDADRCRALTESGERCSRPAREDGFCYQHDETDETVGDETAGDGTADPSGHETDRPAGEKPADPASVESDGGQQMEEESEADGESETGDDGGSTAEASDEHGGSEGRPDVLAVRDSVASMVGPLIGRELDGVIEVTSHDGGWEVVVEVVERSAVPDTQDILGRYEITLEDPDTVTGYRRVDTYRRSGSSRDEASR